MNKELYFFENILVKNLLKKEFAKIKLEKIYVKMKIFFIYCQSKGLSVHISKGCKPYFIMISLEINIG